MTAYWAQISFLGYWKQKILVHSITNILNASERCTLNGELYVCILTHSKEGRRKERKQKETEGTKQEKIIETLR